MQGVYRKRDWCSGIQKGIFLLSAHIKNISPLASSHEEMKGENECEWMVARIASIGPRRSRFDLEMLLFGGKGCH